MLASSDFIQPGNERAVAPIVLALVVKNFDEQFGFFDSSDQENRVSIKLQKKATLIGNLRRRVRFQSTVVTQTFKTCSSGKQRDQEE